MSPRLLPSEPTLATVYQQPSQEPFVDRALDAADRRNEERYLDALEQERHNPYASGRHSYFRDLFAIAEAQLRRQGTFEAPRFGSLPAPSDPPSFGWPNEEEARRRLSRWEQRDLAGGSSPDLLRPNAPIAGVFGQAARQTGKLAGVFDRLPLQPGMVDVSSGVPVVTIPRLATGAAVGTGTENSSVTELDPTSASASSAVGTRSTKASTSLVMLM
jgi:hypothetical protein